jgi:hypothetical protein
MVVRYTESHFIRFVTRLPLVIQWTLQSPCSCHVYIPSTLTCDSQNLAPVYEQLGDAFAHAKDKVVIAKVDADGEGRPLGSKYDVTGFPSTHT